MKGYKASVKGKCRNQVYELGKTYKMEFITEGEIELCNCGFHFCKDPKDVFRFYRPTDNNLVIFEVEALGNIKTGYDKSVTDEIKIIREIPKQEYNSIFTNCEFKFDSNDNLIWKKDLDGEIWEFKYDENNNLIWKKDSDGDIWEYKFDSNNNCISEKNSNGDIIEYKFDSNNNLIWSKDFDGDIWEYEYDENNNLIWEKASDGDIWEYKFASNNNCIWKKASDGDIWEYKFDSNNNCIWKRTPSGTIYEYPSYKVISY